MSIRRYVLTGAPGAGKTTLIDALRARGHTVVAEAATDVIARGHAAGREPSDTFLSDILELQREREEAARGELVFFDRSPVCTLALAHYVRLPVPAALAEAAGRASKFYQRRAFLVRPLGFVEKTAARRISYADSLRFGAIHEEVYAAHGFTLIGLAKAPVADRVAVILREVSTS